MGASHKGYVSFLLFSQLSFLLLLPFLIPQNHSSASLIGAYAADSAYREHVSFKRAIKSCATGALNDLQSGIAAPAILPDGRAQPRIAAQESQPFGSQAGAIAFASPQAVPGAQKPFSELLHSEQEQALRLEAIRRWLILESEWGDKTDFDAKISCAANSGFSHSDAELYLQCAQKIRLSEDGRAVELLPGIMARASSRSSGAIAASELMEGRLQ